MTTGTVKFFDDNKGFGFISMEDEDEDCFVHHSEIQMEGFKTLDEGDKVEFELTQNDRGPAAKSVRKVG